MNHYSTYWIIDAPIYNGNEPNWATDQRTSGDGNGYNQYNGSIIGPKAESDWLFDVPSGIYKMIKWVDERYGNPLIYITENGCDAPNEDALPFDEIINDTFRIHYLAGYITEITRAKQTGSNIGGYFVWSLMDNFEWAVGYQKRFGLHYVNYTQNLTRYQKNSAKWYAEYIKMNPNAKYIAGGDDDDDVDKKHGLRTGVIVAIALGSAALVIGAVLLMYRLKQRNKLKANATDQDAYVQVNDN